MARYARKDGCIEAIRFFDSEGTLEAVKDMIGQGPGSALGIDYTETDKPVLKVKNLRVRLGEWIVRTIDNKFIVMNDNTFLSIYECVNG